PAAVPCLPVAQPHPGAPRRDGVPPRAREVARRPRRRGEVTRDGLFNVRKFGACIDGTEHLSISRTAYLACPFWCRALAVACPVAVAPGRAGTGLRPRAPPRRQSHSRP